MAEVPAPARGAVVKRLGELLTEHKADLATLVSLEVGKITSEALGEVQEMIDICDFAVGLSRQLYGRTSVSERPGHRLMETWHPLGVVGVISAFNFPCAVWSWNTAIALVCGDTVVWKPSEQAPLTAWASAALLDRALSECGAPRDVSQVVVGGPEVGEAIVDHPGVALAQRHRLHAHGPRGRAAGREPLRPVPARTRREQRCGGRTLRRPRPRVAGHRVRRRRYGRTALHHHATRHRPHLRGRGADRPPGGGLRSAAHRQPDGRGHARGPPCSPAGLRGHGVRHRAAQSEGGKLMAGGERVLADAAQDAFYVEPAIVAMPGQSDVVRSETFAPLLYVLTYEDFDEAIALNNGVPQGLSSSVFTRDQAEAEIFCSAEGSDCGIVNVNIGTSGAEIGGAFGGEKETGGGRESGSDAWRAYMRRATNTVNYSGELPLAQGVDFSI